MNSIELLLSRGIIRITSFNNSLVLIAAFIASGNKIPIKVHSDRGIEHLLLLLHAKITQEDRTDEINSLYPSALSMVGTEQTKYLHDIQFVLERSLTELSYQKQRFCVTIRQYFTPSITDDPGEYVKEGEGPCLKSALLCAIEAPSTLNH